MNMIFLTLNLIAIINILILCTYLVCRKNNITPNYLLAIILVIPGFYFVDNILILTNYLQEYPYAFFIVQIIAVAFPICVYHYIHLLLKKSTFNYYLLAGSTLLLIYILYLTGLFHTYSDTEKVHYIELLNSEDTYPLTMLIYTNLFYLWQMVYFVVLLIETRKYQMNAERTFSNFESIKIDYIKRFLYLLGILNTGLVFFYIALPMPIVDYGILPTIVTIIYGFIMFNTVKYNAIFDKKSYDFLVLQNHEIVEFKDETPQLSELITKVPLDEKIKELGQKIETLLDENKLFALPDLKLKNIAEQLKEPEYLVSKALNQYFNKSFYELIVFRFKNLSKIKL